MALNKKKCLKCGTENPIHAEFCSECGEGLSNNNSPEFDQIKGDNPLSRAFSKWERQSKETKIISSVIGCCLGIVIFLILITLIFPTTALSLENDNVEIDNQTTNYTIKGKTETNATVKISSSALNLNNVEVKVAEDGSFEHKLKIPINVTELEVKVTAKHPKKIENFKEITIKRPLTPLSVNKPAKLKPTEETLNLGGKTDPNTEVTFTSADLNIEPVKAKSDSNGNFNGKIKVAKDKSNGKITVTAKAVGKRANNETVEISRESKKSPKSTKTTTTPSEKKTVTTSNYEKITVGGLQCEIDKSKTGGTNRDVSGKSFYEAPDTSFAIEVYTSTSRYYDALNYAAGERGSRVSTETVSGHEILCYRSNSGITYFFTVNGIEVGVLADGNSIDTHLVESFYKLN